MVIIHCPFNGVLLRQYVMLILKINSNQLFTSLFIIADKCDVPLGIQDGRITQSMLTASSMYNRYYGPWSARLQARNHGAVRGGWLARVNNNHQWLQIDLGAKSVVKRIATQGRYDANQWVTSYTVSYSNNGVRFYPYRENRRVRVCSLRVSFCFAYWYCLALILLRLNFYPSFSRSGENIHKIPDVFTR